VAGRSAEAEERRPSGRIDADQPRCDSVGSPLDALPSNLRTHADPRASLLDVPLVQAAQNFVPVAVTAGDKIEVLCQWASGRCFSADRAGLYSRTEGVSSGRVRRVVREPGVN